VPAVWVLGFTFLLTGTTLPAAGPGASGSAASSSAAPARIVPKDDAHLSQYRAFRRMHARSDKFNQEAWLDAWTELDADGFRFQIVAERGSEYVRNKVLKAVLKREQQLVAEGPERASFTEANYVFVDGEVEDDGSRSILMKPRRKDVVLVDGRMVLSPDGAEILRVEGRLAKNPSFWTSAVNIVRHFATIDGVRVPVSTESIAKVKLAGHSRLAVSYEYESINGRPVSTAARQILASATAGGAR
jgi:hypothetical protein